MFKQPITEANSSKIPGERWGGGVVLGRGQPQLIDPPTHIRKIVPQEKKGNYDKGPKFEVNNPPRG